MIVRPIAGIRKKAMHRQFVGRFCMILGFAMALSLPLQVAGAQQIQATVSGAAPVKSSSKKNIQASLDPAVENAAQAAWRVFRARADFENVVTKLGREDHGKISAALLDDNVCQRFIIDQAYDKTTGNVTWRFRFDCDQQLLLTEVQNLVAGGAGGAGTVSLAGISLTGIFYAIRDLQVTEFDADIEKSRSDTLGMSARTDAAASLSTDDRVKAGSKSSEKESVKYGESAGSISEGVNRSQTLDGRTKTDSSMQASASFDATTTVSQSSRSGGRTTRRSAEVERTITSAQAIERALGSSLQQQDVDFYEYSNIEVQCGGPGWEVIRSELQALDREADLKMTATTRTKAHVAAKSCSIGFFVEGYAKIGAPMTDPVTGNTRVNVSVAQAVYDLRGPMARQVSITPERQSYGVGLDESTATQNALAKAADLVSSQTNQDLVSRLSAQ